MKTDNQSNMSAYNKCKGMLCHGPIYMMLGSFAVLAVYLLLLAGFSTTAIDAKDEHSFLIKDSMILNVVEAGIFFMFCLLLTRYSRFKQFVNRINEDIAYYKRCRRIALTALGVICIFLLIALQAGPMSDQAYISATAKRMMNSDYSDFSRGSYMELYPHQMGIVFFLYALAHVVGADNYLAFQFLNVLALLLIYWNFSEMAGLTGHRNIVGLIIVWCGFLFFPAILYTTFIYGNLLGLAVSLCAVRHFVRVFYRRDSVTIAQSKMQLIFRMQGRLCCSLLVAAEMIVALAEIFVAIAFKSNYQIFAIGIAVFIALMTIREGNCVGGVWIKAGICIIGILVILLYGSKAINKAAGKMFGVDLSGGVSHWAWVAMGLQENDTKYDGWYNDYTLSTYYAANSSAERQDPVVKEYIGNRIQEFLADPEGAIRFFAGKNASQWNNPTFQAYYCVRDMSNNVPRSRLVNALLSVDSEKVAEDFLNQFQFIVLLGSVVYTFVGIRKRKDKETDVVAVFYMVTVIGGFLFHSFWEAKSQYIFTYFMLFIPLGIYGGESIADAFSTEKVIPAGASWSPKGYRGVKAEYSRLFLALLTISGGIFVLGRAGNSFCQDVFLRQENTSDYKTHIKQYHYIKLQNTAYMENVGGKEIWFLPSKYDISYCLCTMNGQMLTVADREDGYAGATFEGRTLFSENNACYIQESEEDGRYYVIHMYGRDQYLLTCDDEGNLYFASRSGDEDQLWKLVTGDGE